KSLTTIATLSFGCMRMTRGTSTFAPACSFMACSCFLLRRVSCTDLMIGHDFERPHQGRMVPARAAMGRAGVEQLWCGRRVGQAYTHRASRGEREVEVLLVQLDAEARVERALDHAFAVHFENARGGKAAHQGLAHLRWVGAGLGSKQKRFAHRLDGE